MATFISNQNNVFELSFARVPLLLDQARVIRLNQPHAEQESDRCNQAPEKHQPLAEICEELDRLLPFDYLQDFALPHYNQGRNLDAIARQEFVGPQPTSQLKINSYYYPPTASKWSVFRGLATSSAVKAMLAATQTTVSQEEQGTATLRTSEASPPAASFTSVTSTTGNNPALFTLLANPLSPDNPNFNASLYTVQTNLYMLPSRPLAEHGGQFDGLFLVTLVDERYWWQYSPISLLGFNRNTWENLISDLATALNITIVHDPIETVYGSPEIDSQLWTNFENAGTLLDAVAANVGRTVVRLYNGTYVLRNALDSLAIVQENRNTAVKLVRVAGGDLFQGPGTLLKADNLNLSKNTVIPELVNVTFPVYVQGDSPVPHFLNPRYAPQRPSAWFEDSFGDAYAVNVPIASGGISIAGLGGTSGYAYSIHDTAKALVSDEQTFTPTNASGLTALSMQLAGDYFSSQVIAALDESYPGTLTWIPEGIHDILFTYSARMRQASTRVLKTEWNQQVKNFQHATPPVLGFSNIPKGVGGPSVAQTVQDTFDNTPVAPSTIPPISTTLAAAVTATDMQLALRSVAYFPTQNRFRVQIDDEILLLEPTGGNVPLGPNFSDGLAATIVYRGIDGTLTAAHAKGALVSQVAPSSVYGVNLVTYEPGQFVYPSYWTSGGIQGANIVPQLQTIQVLDDVGTKINKIQHYSGVLNLYDTTQISGFQWIGQESIWAVERTGLGVASGFRYGGQLVGYSASGQVAPVYAIGDGSAGTGGGTGTSLIVEQVDLKVVVPNVNTIQFDQDDGFVVSQPAPGIARIDLTPTGTGTGIETGQYDSSNPLGDPDTTGVVTQLFFDADAGFSATGAGGDPGFVSLQDVFLADNRVIAWPRGKVNPDNSFNQMVGITSADNPRINGVAFPGINLDLFVPGLDLILNANADGNHNAALLLFGGGSNNQGPVFPQYAISTTTGIGFGVDADGDNLTLSIRGGIVVGAIAAIGFFTPPQTANIAAMISLRT